MESKFDSSGPVAMRKKERKDTRGYTSLQRSRERADPQGLSLSPCQNNNSERSSNIKKGNQERKEGKQKQSYRTSFCCMLNTVKQ